MLGAISPETQAVLLLYARWGKDSGDGDPLSVGEFNRLADWLGAESLSPGDLLDADGFAKYDANPLEGITPGRLEALLKSSGIMTIQVEQLMNNGFWIISRYDDEYPGRLNRVLESHAPPLLFGIGPMSLLPEGGIAVVGSRDVDGNGATFAEEFGGACAMKKIALISGGARGVDQISMAGALNNGGRAVCVLAGGLAQMAVAAGNRQAVEEERLTLVSPYHPRAGFSVGQAMSRNKLIYALADAAVVVSATLRKGGTWAGAEENIRKWHTPLYVRTDDNIPGNAALIKEGAKPFPEDAMNDPAVLFEPIKQDETGGKPMQIGLFE